jgi:hypothetical protein
MKPFLLLGTLLLALFAPDLKAQQPASEKPPLYVPADAKYFKGKWYRVYTEKASWRRAVDKCKTLRGQLALVPDKETWEFIKTLSSASLWLGATDEKAEGDWRWLDGTPVKFAVWITNNPNNQGGKEHYLAMVTHENKQGWNDFDMEGTTKTLTVSGSVCEWDAK